MQSALRLLAELVGHDAPDAVAPVVRARSLDDAALRREIIRRLQACPFHLILRSRHDAFAPAAVEALMAALAPDARLSLTRIEIDAEEAAKATLGTRYSRTNQPLALHTDTAHVPRPHSLVGFQMIRADPAGGGRSILVPVAEVVAGLDAADVAMLREPHFDFGRGPVPILWGPPHAPSMRYYRAQLDARAGTEQPAATAALLDRLDARLAALAPARTFDLLPGDLLLINNHKALHGRTGFPEISDRLMLRYRVRVRELG